MPNSVVLFIYALLSITTTLTNVGKAAVVSSLTFSATVMSSSMERLIQRGCLVQHAEVRSTIECVLMCARDDSCIQSVLQENTTALPVCYFEKPCEKNTDASSIFADYNQARTDIQFWHRPNVCLNGASISIVADRTCDCVNFYVGMYCQRLPNNCTELMQAGYTMENPTWVLSSTGPPLLCKIEKTTALMVVRRVLFQTNGYFNRSLPWHDYKYGFYLDTFNFWVGLETMYTIMNKVGNVILRTKVQVEDIAGYSASYFGFRLQNETMGYSYAYDSVLVNTKGTIPSHITPYDSWFQTQNTPFSTWDRDQDQDNTVNCACFASGGWWFARCDPSGQWANPNGISSASPLTPDPSAKMTAQGFDFTDSALRITNSSMFRVLIYEIGKTKLN